MNKRRIFVGVSVILVLVYYVILYSKDYELKPVVLIDDELVFEENHNKELFREQIVKVLDYYFESYRIDEGDRVMVGRSLIIKKELLWNYTSKARDKDWLKIRGVAHLRLELSDLLWFRVKYDYQRNT